MDEREVQRILRRERKLWGALLLVSMIFMQVMTVYITPRQHISAIETSFSGVEEGVVSNRRQLLEVPTEKNNQRKGKKRMSKRAEKEAPVVEAPLPEFYPSVEENLEDVERADCNCPPGPPGPQGVAGEPAPEFLSEVMEWDPSRKSLMITAATVEINGHIIVNGFAGVKQSLFVGGDPTSGESATEVAPGGLQMYSSEGNPMIAGFSTDENGFQPSEINAMDGLNVVNSKTGELNKV